MHLNGYYQYKKVKKNSGEGKIPPLDIRLVQCKNIHCRHTGINHSRIDGKPNERGACNVPSGHAVGEKCGCKHFTP